MGVAAKELPDEAPHVLLLDEGQGFGGSVVVAATLLRFVNRRSFRTTLVTAADPRFLEARISDAGHVCQARPRYTYVEAARIRSAFLQIPIVGRGLNFVASKFMSLANAGYVTRIAVLMLQRHTALVHCNNFANFEGLLLAWLFRVPCLLHAHGLIGPTGPMSNWLMRRLKPGVIAISQVVADSVATSGAPVRFIRVAYNPVSVGKAHPLDRERFRRMLGIPQDAILAGMVGRIIPWKGQLEFVTACVEALQRTPTLHAILVGNASDTDSQYFEIVRSLAAASPVADRIHFAGFVADTVAMYASLDMLVHCSIEPEPFGLVITEAMAHGVAVIAARSGAPVEFLEHGITGFLESPSDSEALGARMTQLARDGELRERIATAGQKHALESFDPERYAESVEAAWRESLAARRAHAEPVGRT